MICLGPTAEEVTRRSRPETNLDWYGICPIMGICALVCICMMRLASPMGEDLWVCEWRGEISSAHRRCWPDRAPPVGSRSRAVCAYVRGGLRIASPFDHKTALRYLLAPRLGRFPSWGATCCCGICYLVYLLIKLHIREQRKIFSLSLGYV